MADRDLVDVWLMDAADAAPGSVAEQIDWLKAERRKYSQAVREGDWEVTATAHEGGSHGAKRGTSDRANHAAIVAAIKRLEEQEGISSDTRSGAVLSFRIHGIQS
jgi:threonine synthase